jgi:hypothetical protein
MAKVRRSLSRSSFVIRHSSLVIRHSSFAAALPPGGTLELTFPS